jgi:hypothetical protein
LANSPTNIHSFVIEKNLSKQEANVLIP